MRLVFVNLVYDIGKARHFVQARAIFFFAFMNILITLLYSFCFYSSGPLDFCYADEDCLSFFRSARHLPRIVGPTAAARIICTFVFLKTNIKIKSFIDIIRST